MGNGYSGKILKVDLTDKSFEEIATADYQEWGGGHGMGSALFWELCEDKTVKGTDPGNVVTIMTSPMSGTLAPGVAGRTEITGIGIQAYPIGWYTRSNFGGRFAGQLKFAGWDGIVLMGKSDTPVWLNIVDDKVTLEDATDLWGLDTYAAQEEIWATVASTDGDWKATSSSRDSGRSTQKAAVICAGPNAEGYGPMAALVHDAGNGAGQGGFGGVFASKNIKAVSVLGTGSVVIADPNALMEARLWAQDYAFAGHHDSLSTALGVFPLASPPGGSTLGDLAPGTAVRPQGCMGCIRNCRTRTETGEGNESHCVDFFWYDAFDRAANGGATTVVTARATDMIQKYALNAFAMEALMLWLSDLMALDLIGPGKEIESSLPFAQFGSEAFAEALCQAIITQTDIGADVALGLAECANKWGRLEEDTTSGILRLQEWGLPHHYDARTEAEWGYGSLIGERDINEHDFNYGVYWSPTVAALSGLELPISAERYSEIVAEKTYPYNDPMMTDYSDEGIYSEAMAKTVSWHRYYTRFWKESILYCDYMWADFCNPYDENYVGLTGEGEPKFLNAVTGGNITYEEGIEIGKRIWNLDRAIWILQGRHRDLEVFAGYNYEVGAQPGTTTYEAPYWCPVYENGEWSYKSVAGRKLDRARVEEWKTKYFELEGWDPATGWPTRATLESVDLGFVADALEAAGKLGA